MYMKLGKLGRWRRRDTDRRVGRTRSGRDFYMVEDDRDFAFQFRSARQLTEKVPRVACIKIAL